MLTESFMFFYESDNLFLRSSGDLSLRPPPNLVPSFTLPLEPATPDTPPIPDVTLLTSKKLQKFKSRENIRADYCVASAPAGMWECRGAGEGRQRDGVCVCVCVCVCVPACPPSPCNAISFPLVEVRGLPDVRSNYTWSRRL
ncbi:hypothetical protein E2C01_036893 [Portunus trituberculatus]|uniref:Uncharacterized protein n=1 Tax=Portunus trituberculatus TaxID=210409 RepID=A0A5B7F7W8_PORTR|nr:hypothetical protein [Portunus trituberculatus]